MKILKNIGKLLSLLLTLTLVACVDYNDESRLIDVKIQVAAPSEYKAGATPGKQLVTLKRGNVSRTATTNENGLVVFEDCAPDVYDVSVAWTLSSTEYYEKTGINDPDHAYIVTASLNEQSITEKYEETPLQLTPAMAEGSPLVISKIYCAGSKPYPQYGTKNYLVGKYFEIYNQTDEAIDITGMYIGLLDSTNPQPWTLENLVADATIQGSAVVVKQVFRIPTDKTYKLEGGKSIVLTNSAIDHSYVSDYEQNLSDADFEREGYNDKMEHNPNVPKLEMVYTASSGLTSMNLSQSGPCGIIIFRTIDDVTTWPKTYGYGKVSGTQTYLLVPNNVIKDGVDYLQYDANTSSGADIATKRLYTSIDAGCTHISAKSGYTGETVYRKTLSIASGGRKILMDTNNSSNDFQVSTTIKVREYDDAE